MSQDVSYLNWKSDASHSFLYEAQTSCVVAGLDIRRWVGYCFVESYFDVDNEARDTPMAYYRDSQGEGGLLMDPCTFGFVPLDGHIKDPREWFLTVLEYRLDQIKGEWRQVVQKIDQSVRDYEKVVGVSTSLNEHRTPADPNK